MWLVTLTRRKGPLVRKVGWWETERDETRCYSFCINLLSQLCVGGLWLFQCWFVIQLSSFSLTLWGFENTLISLCSASNKELASQCFFISVIADTWVGHRIHYVIVSSSPQTTRYRIFSKSSVYFRCLVFNLNFRMWMRLHLMIRILLWQLLHSCMKASSLKFTMALGIWLRWWCSSSNSRDMHPALLYYSLSYTTAIIEGHECSVSTFICVSSTRWLKWMYNGVVMVISYFICSIGVDPYWKL